MRNNKNFNFGITLIFLISALVILSTGCADVEQVKQCTLGHTYGFWGGLWHGIVAPFSFIGRLFSDDISIYAMNNNGRWYDFGFILGAGNLLFFGGRWK